MIFKEFIYSKNNEYNFFNALDLNNKYYFSTTHGNPKALQRNNLYYENSIINSESYKFYKDNLTLVKEYFNLSLEDRIINLLYNKDVEIRKLGFSMLDKKLNTIKENE